VGILPDPARQLKGIMAVRSRVVTARRSPSPEGGSREDARRQLSFIERLTPGWGREASDWIAKEASESSAWFMACGLMSLVVLFIGIVMLFGDGFATIQAIRYALRAFGLTQVRVDNIPPLQWWLIQLILILIQVFGKHIRGLRPLWRPSIIFNSVTTGMFIGLANARLFSIDFGFVEGTLRPTDGTIVSGIIGAILGQILAVGAEQVALVGICMLFVGMWRAFSMRPEPDR
jgi:hypothetical protein